MRKLSLWLALLVFLTGCAKAPDPVPERESQPSEQAASLQATETEGLPAGMAALRPEDVSFIRYIPPLPPGQRVYRPLFGGRPEDRAWIETLLKAMANAKPAAPEGASGEHRRVAWTEVRLTNGRRIMFREAWECVTEGNGTNCHSVPGRMVLAEGERRYVVEAPDLEAFPRERAMPMVDQFAVTPEAPRAGQPFTVTGDGWPEATRFTLTLLKDGITQQLAEGNVTFGGWTWTGALKKELPPGEYQLDLKLDRGAQITRSLTISP